MVITLPHRLIAAWSSTALRLFTFVFLRWIPGHPFPPVIYSCFVAYAISFYLSSPQSPELDTGAEARKANDANSSTDKANGDIRATFVNSIETKPKDTLKALLLGIPSPSPTWNLLSFGINTLLVVLTVYYVFSPLVLSSPNHLSFARVGYASETSANIFVRIPALAVAGKLVYAIAEPGKPLGKEEEVPAFSHEVKAVVLRPDQTDRTVTVNIANLIPDTRYQFDISYYGKKSDIVNSYTGNFITAPRVGSFSHRGSGTFSFVFTSCMIQNFPFNPLSHPLSIRGFEYLGQILTKLRPTFMLFLGDFIYIDVPRRHGSGIDTYRREYRQIYAAPDWPSASKVYPEITSDNREPGYGYDLPWIHVWDDHEIANDWSGKTKGVFRPAFDPYLHYHLRPNPPLPGKPLNMGDPNRESTEPFLSEESPTYTSFNQGPASFFLTETRRYREPPSAHKNTTLLGKQQLNALLSWIKAPAPRGVMWKFIVSSSPFTKNWRAINTDMWPSYTVERRKLLEAMWDYASVPGSAGIVVLTGDRHEFVATAMPPPEGVMSHGSKNQRWHARGTVHELSVSPLSQFYLPFRTYFEDRPRKRASSATEQLASEQEESDVLIKYIPTGNSKFVSIDIEPPTSSGVSLLRYKLFVDGKEAWSDYLSSEGRIG